MDRTSKRDLDLKKILPVFIQTNQDDVQEKKCAESSRRQKNIPNFPPDAAIGKIKYLQIGGSAL